MLEGDTEELHGEVPGAWLGYLPPFLQSRELYIGSSIPALRNRVIYQGSVAQPAGLTRCSCWHAAVLQRGSSHGRSQLCPRCWAGGAKGQQCWGDPISEGFSNL